MKSEYDQFFEGGLRSRLAGQDPPLPPGGFAAIRQRLATRRRKRRVIRLLILAALAVAAGGLGWQDSDPAILPGAEASPLSHPAATKAGQDSRPDADSSPETSSAGAPGRESAAGTARPTGATPAPSRRPLHPAPVPAGIKARRYGKLEPPESLAAHNAPPFPAPKESRMPISGLSEKKTKKALLPGSSPGPVAGLQDTGAIPALPSPFHPLPALPAPESALSGKPSWEWGFLPAAHFYHAIPDRRDDVHFYALEDGRQDWSLGTMIGARWPLSTRLSLGVQARYSFTQTTARLERIEKDEGSLALIQPRNSTEPLFFEGYSQRSEEIAGGFHQLGVGGGLRCRLFGRNNGTVDAQMDAIYLKSLNAPKGALFPGQEFRTELSLGFRHPVHNRMALAIRPSFSYGVALGAPSEALQVNRLLWGLGFFAESW